MPPGTAILQGGHRHDRGGRVPGRAVYRARAGGCAEPVPARPAGLAAALTTAQGAGAVAGA